MSWSEQLSPLSRAQHLIPPPRRAMLHHGVENGEELSHTGGERHFLRLPRHTEALGEGANHGIAAGRHQRRHRQGRPHMSAAAPHGAFAAERPAITVQRGDPDECGTLLPAQGPQLGEIRNERPSEPWPHPWHRAEQIVFVPPDRTLANGVGEVADRSAPHHVPAT
jgi:hypothetical protein